ncbi:MAG: hypothetical protein RLW87_04205 [Alphaproteobacteria bacterium]|jgi:hypothetical protein|nr:hypothetical protein [Alphaproteobacteria bacterium]MBO6865283.1 hypothetical protein [Alphaproteobacteria bacterium]
MAQNDFDPNENPVRANRGIVIVVATLGVLIVLGLGGLVYGIAMKAGKLGSSDAPQSAQNDAAAPAPAAPMPVPAPSVATSASGIVSMTADAGILYIHIRTDEGRDIVRAYDRQGVMLFEIDPAAK